MGEGGGVGAEPDLLAGDRVLALHAERAGVEVALGDEPAPAPVGDDGVDGGGRVGAVAEHGLLPWRAIGRQPAHQAGGGDSALLDAGGAGDAQAEALERAGLDRLDEDAGVEILRVVQVPVAVAQVHHAVEDAHGVAHQPAIDVPADLQADVAVGHQIGRQATLGKVEVRRRLQALETDRRLELAGPHR